MQAGYNAYGAPVVLRDSGDSQAHLAGGIFPHAGLNGLGDMAEDTWNQGRQFAVSKGLPDPGPYPWSKGSGGGGGGGGGGKPSAPPDAGILGIPTPVAIVGALAAAAYALSQQKRSNPRRKRR